VIQPKTPKKIKGARKKRRAEEKEREKSKDTGIYKHGDTLYIKQEVIDSYLEAKLIKSGIKYYIMPEPLCEYAVPKKISEKCPFPYKCSIMYECRYKHPTQKTTANCPRKQNGDNIKKEKRHEQRSRAYKRN